MDRVFCPKCGKELKPIGKFCKYCGAPIALSNNGSSQEKAPKDIPTMSRKPTQKGMNNNSVPGTGEFGMLGAITTLIIKIIILLVIARTFLYVLDHLGTLGGVLIIIDSSAVFAGLAIIGFLEIGLATFVKKYSSGKIDRLFLLLPIIPVIITVVLVVLNIGQFFRTLGISEGIISLLLLVAGYYDCSMTYTIRFRKKALKRQMANMSDKEIDELKQYTVNPDEIDKMKAECKADCKQEEM